MKRPPNRGHRPMFRRDFSQRSKRTASTHANASTPTASGPNTPVFQDIQRISGLCPLIKAAVYNPLDRNPGRLTLLQLYKTGQDMRRKTIHIKRAGKNIAICRLQGIPCAIRQTVTMQCQIHKFSLPGQAGPQMFQQNTAGAAGWLWTSIHQCNPHNITFSSPSADSKKRISPMAPS